MRQWGNDAGVAVFLTWLIFSIGAVVDPYFEYRSSVANVLLTALVVIGAIRIGRWLGRLLMTSDRSSR